MKWAICGLIILGCSLVNTLAQSLEPAAMLTACPYLPSADVEQGAKFYVDVLGFQVRHQEGKAFALMSHGEVEVALSRKKECFAPGACMIKVRNIEALHEKCVAAKAPIKSPLETKPWGMKMFTVTDPDGNELDFGEMASE